MLRDETKPKWKLRSIALFAMAAAVAGGLWLSNMAESSAQRAAAASCNGFAADAQKLFENGGTGTLSGTFAPGDRVHLSIDFSGAGAWQSTGVLGIAESRVTGLVISTRSRTFKTSFGGLINLLRKPPVINESGGTVSGAARLDLEIDVTAAGDGAITINKTSSVASVAPPTIASASCATVKARTARR